MTPPTQDALRRAVPPSCGVSGVYFLAKDGDPVVEEGV